MNQLKNTLALVPAVATLGGLLAVNYASSTAKSVADYELLSGFQRPIHSSLGFSLLLAAKTAQHYFGAPRDKYEDLKSLAIGLGGNLAIRATIGAIVGTPLSQQPIFENLVCSAAMIGGASALAPGIATLLHGLSLSSEFITP